MKTKCCTSCEEEKPETNIFWFKKAKNKEGFRSTCKTCVNNQNTENRILKRCKELGIDRCDWEVFIRKELMNRDIFKLKDDRLKDVPRPTRARILRKIREENYVFTTIEDYKKNALKTEVKVKENTNTIMTF